ncbi:hypothetical protein VNI00_009819 [Paramarasmius palmivorus]|uniref:Uncharacterized protein n=1 Tax=Paramarasmius palmivorus TaxID=297713 RepID=A0AAW0CKZ9_9AGAR
MAPTQETKDQDIDRVVKERRASQDPDTYITRQFEEFAETNNSVQIYDKNGVKTENGPDANLKGYRTENRGIFAVTNNGSVLTMENGTPNIATSVERRTGLSFTTENYASGALTNNGSALPVSYVEHAQLRTMKMMEAYRNGLEARSASSSKPVDDAVEEARREAEDLQRLSALPSPPTSSPSKLEIGIGR